MARCARRCVHVVATGADDRWHYSHRDCGGRPLEGPDAVRSSLFSLTVCPPGRPPAEPTSRGQREWAGAGVAADSVSSIHFVGCAQGAGVSERQPVPHVPAVRHVPRLVPERDVQLRDNGARLRLARHRLLRRLHLTLGYATLHSHTAASPSRTRATRSGRLRARATRTFF